MDAHYVGPYFITRPQGKGFYSLQGVADPNDVVPRVCGAYLKVYSDAEEFFKKKQVTPCFQYMEILCREIYVCTSPMHDQQYDKN